MNPKIDIAKVVLAIIHGHLRLQNIELGHRPDAVPGFDLGKPALRVEALFVDKLAGLQQAEYLEKGFSRVACQPLPGGFIVDAARVPFGEGLADRRESREAQGELHIDLGAYVLVVRGENGGRQTSDARRSDYRRDVHQSFLA